MAKRPVGVTETQVARAVMHIAAQQPNKVATFHRIKREGPTLLNLTEADRGRSPTRPNEAMWEQRIRNIKSHSTVPGNFIYEGYLEHVPRVGYRITEAGMAYLNRRR